MRREPSATRPRVAFITTVYDSGSVGGATFVRQMREAVEAGTLDVVFFSDDMASETLPWERRVPIPRLLRSLPGGFLVRGLFLRQALRREHQLRPFDLIWHNNAITSFGERFASRCAPVVVMINDYANAQAVSPLTQRRAIGVSQAVIRFCWRAVECRAARAADAVVVNSRFLEREVARGYDIRPDRLQLMYKSVEFAIPVPPRPAPSAGSLRLLFVKRNYRIGGLEDLLRAAAQLPGRVRVTIAGPAPNEFAVIRSMAAHAGFTGALRLLGALDRDAVRAELASNDILCIPSRSEALGVAFMEALAAGLPAIGTRVGGIPEVLDDDRAGWLAAPYDPDDLAAQIRNVCADADERERRRRHGLAWVQRFSVDRMVTRFLEIASLAGHSARPPS